MSKRPFLGAPSARLGAAAANYPALIHASGFLAIVVSATYLTFRVLVTFEGSQLVAFAVLFAAELFSLITLVLFFMTRGECRR